MWYVYILLSDIVRRTYIGSTDNLKRRLYQHNSRLVKSSAPYAPWTLLHSEDFVSEIEARRREKWLKTGAGRRFLKKIIDKKINNLGR